MRRFGVVLATAGGAGYFPVAPGTVGSAVGIGIYLLTCAWPFGWQLALISVIAIAGTWAGSQAEAHFGRADPGEVVIDEVAGQLVTLVGTGASVWGVLLGFVVFRILDIVKPWPARRFERFPGGMGIMADDLMAGIYGNLLVRVARLVVSAGAW